MTPECPTGACSFRADSRTTGNRFRYRFDKALGDYLDTYQYTEDCVNSKTEEALVADGYKVSVTDQLSVVDSVIADADGVDYATQMVGTSQEEPTLTPEADAAGCSAKDLNYDLLVIRTDQPEGDPANPPPEGVDE